MSHRHFTLEDRNVIQHSLEDAKTHREIATKLGCSHTAINEEIRRNSVQFEIVLTSRVNKPRILSLDLRHQRGKGEVPEKLATLKRYKERLARFARGQAVYIAEVAHTMYLQRRAIASQSNYRLRDGYPLTERIAALLFSRAKDSPEQISANLRKEGIVVGCQTIYRWITRSSRTKRLEQRLRRRGKPYRYGAGAQASWNKTKNKRNIHTRPAVVDQLERYGDLEGDTIVGSDKKDRLLTHVDRATGIVSLSRIIGFDAHTITKQTTVDIARVFGNDTHTITYDNGTEFSAWEKTEVDTDTTIYFADPYRSSQRGRSENTNGLVRDYFPKGTDFKKITDQELREVEDILNNRSCKRYNWKSPFEQREYIKAMT